MTGYRLAFIISRTLALYFFGRFLLGLSSVFYLWNGFQMLRSQADRFFIEMAIPATSAGISSLLLVLFSFVLWFYAEAIAGVSVPAGDHPVAVSGQTLWTIGLRLLGLYLLIVYGAEAIATGAVTSRTEDDYKLRFFIGLGIAILGIVLLFAGSFGRSLFRAKAEQEHRKE